MIVLTIKKDYLQQIVSGEKVYEYRPCNSRYNRLKGYKGRLKLHYYRSHHIVCEVVETKRIKTPKSLIGQCNLDKHCYRLRLKFLFENT